MQPLYYTKGVYIAYIYIYIHLSLYIYIYIYIYEYMYKAGYLPRMPLGSFFGGGRDRRDQRLRYNLTYVVPPEGRAMFSHFSTDRFHSQDMPLAWNLDLRPSGRTPSIEKEKGNLDGPESQGFLVHVK